MGNTYRALILNLVSPSPTTCCLEQVNNNNNNNPHPLTKTLIRNPSLTTTATAKRRRQLLLFTLLPINILSSSSSSSSSSALANSLLDLVSREDKEASLVVSQRVEEAVELLERGRELQAQGDFPQALLFFTQVIEGYKDLALSDYARVGRALALYEVGDREDAIAEMEDVSISLKGYPEVHAALAAALYVDKHAPILAENQFAIATLLDPQYTDISYVRETKHWPPSLISSLKNFITLS